MQTVRIAVATYCLQAEREAVKSGLSGPGCSAAEAALREHFSGEEGTRALEQQVCLLQFIAHSIGVAEFRKLHLGTPGLAGFADWYIYF